MNSPGIACLALLLLTSHAVAGDDLLIEAIQNADHATLLSLLDRKDSDVNGSRGDGSTALHHRVDTAIDEFGRAALTPREAEVVRLLLRGYSTKAAAESPGIAVEIGRASCRDSG